MIRQGLADDIPQIAALLVTTWQEGYASFLPTSFLDAMEVDHQIRRHEKYLNSGAQYYVVEGAEGHLEGFGSYGKSRIAIPDSQTELFTLYVSMQQQGKGIGRRILERIVADMKANTPLDVLVMRNNPYREFYRKNGFEAIGEEEVDFVDFQEKGIILRRFS